MQYRLALAAALALAVPACDDSTGITAEQIACPTTPTLTYANFGQAFVDDNCLECHKTKEKPYLDTQARVQTNINDMIDEAVYHSSMPEDGDLTNEERIMLGQWLMCGAL